MEEERNGGLELRGGASSDIRFYKERAGILERSQGGWTIMKVEGTGLLNPRLPPSMSGVG